MNSRTFPCLYSVLLATALLFTAAPPAFAAPRSPEGLTLLKAALNLNEDSDLELVRELYQIHSAELTLVQFAAVPPEADEARLRLKELNALYEAVFGMTAPLPDLNLCNPECDDGVYSIYSARNPNPRSADGFDHKLFTELCERLLDGKRTLH